MRNWLKHWWKDYTDLKLFELVIVCVLLLVLFLVDKILDQAVTEIQPTSFNYVSIITASQCKCKKNDQDDCVVAHPISSERLQFNSLTKNK